MIKKIRSLAILNLLGFIISALVANLAQFKVLGLPDTMTSVSARYESFFTPAGITFAIWGLIYVSLLAFCIYHLVHAFSKHADERVNQDVTKIGYLFIVNTLATTAWVYAFLGNQLLLSVICMLIQLYSLLQIQLKLNIFDSHRSFWTKAFSQFPLSIYFAWICIATIANISVYLLSMEWNGWGLAPNLWAILLIGIATFISVFMVFVRKNIFFGLVVVWALYGILLKRQPDLTPASQTVVTAALAAMVLLFLTIGIQLLKSISPKINR
jgi:hypothetical protein